jgi:hypothetical protein
VSLFRETADVSVRPAVPGDDVAMTAIQVGAWRASHTEVLGDEVLDALDTVRMREQWAAAISSPPGPGFAVLVACAGADVVGFAAVAPGQVLALEVEPRHQGTARACSPPRSTGCAATARTRSSRGSSTATTPARRSSPDPAWGSTAGRARSRPGCGTSSSTGGPPRSEPLGSLRPAHRRAELVTRS